MAGWILDNLTWIISFVLGGSFTGFAWLIRLDSKVRYLLKRDKEKADILKSIDENLQAIKEKVAVILDRQERGEHSGGPQ